MNSHDTMQRLRAARPADGQPAGDDGLFTRIVAEPGDARLGTSPNRRARLLSLGRSRLLAGGSLGTAGVVVAAILAFTGGTAAPAFAVTREADGSVLVTLSNPHAIIAADKQLVAMGIREQIMYQTAAGAATSSAPVACKLVMGPGNDTAAPKSAGPQVKLRLGTDNTSVIPSKDANLDGSGVVSGTVHLASCVSYPEGPGTALGNSGQAFLNANGG